MIQTLIEYGADVSAKAENDLTSREYTADDLLSLCPERYRTRSLLQYNTSPSHQEQGRRLRQQVWL